MMKRSLLLHFTVLFGELLAVLLNSSGRQLSPFLDETVDQDLDGASGDVFEFTRAVGHYYK